MNTSRNIYIGRFAPSPTGPLHLGSLLTAVASYLDAQANHGKWLLRIDDLDTFRQQAGASLAIIHSLQAHALHWHDDIVWQSKRQAAYQTQFDKLQQQNALFPCTCTRQALKMLPAYPGNCRHQTVADLNNSTAYAWRINCSNSPTICFNDLMQGAQQANLNEHGGDFIIKRKDSLFAYHLAVSVDDDFQKITHIIRGIDLLNSTPNHIFLQKRLGFSTPMYGHIPVLVDSRGFKLSKQAGATAIDDNTPEKNLRRVLCYLHQQPPPTEYKCCEDILRWAVQHWNKQALLNTTEIII